LGLETDVWEGRDELSKWELRLADNSAYEGVRSMSLLYGKAIIPCPGPLDWKDPYKEEPAAFQDFIVDHDDSGNPVYDTCDYEQIRADWGRAMAPVYFKRSVLAKYYNEPHRYEVSATELCCGSNWHLNIDNDNRRYVIVFLKDLCSLPASERDHWRQYNMVPDGPISESSFMRNVLGSFANPAMPDIKFKLLYRRLNERWQEIYGWPLWDEPGAADEHILRQVHICLEDNQAEFDSQNGLMAKLLSDFLNRERLKGSLNSLNDFMHADGFEDANEKLGPLFAFQALRSSGAVHRKGDNYDKAIARAGLADIPLEDASYRLFERAVEALEWLMECLNRKSAVRL
jgi:hypothetical protein